MNWIKVEDNSKLPKKDGEYIVYSGLRKEVYACEMKHGFWEFDSLIYGIEYIF